MAEREGFELEAFSRRPPASRNPELEAKDLYRDDRKWRLAERGGFDLPSILQVIDFRQHRLKQAWIKGIP